MKKTISLAIAIGFLLLPIFAVAAEQKVTNEDLLTSITDAITKEDKLEKKIENILASPGVKVNGEVLFSMTDILYMGNASKDITGDALGRSARYRPMIQYLDLDFNAVIAKGISATGIFRFESVLGGSWGEKNIYGFRRLFAKGENPYVNYFVGDFQGKMTELTLFAPDSDANDFAEADIFKYRKDTNKAELNLGDNAWPISGIWLGHDYNIVDKTFGVGFKLLGSYIGKEGAIMVKLDPADPGLANYAMANHNQFLIGGSPSVMIMDMARINFNYVNLFEVKDSGINTNPAFKNEVWSVDGKVDIIKDMISLSGEFASAVYDADVQTYTAKATTLEQKNPDYLVNMAAGSFPSIEYSDVAFKGSVEIKLLDILDIMPKIELKGGYYSTGKNFVNFMAQTRTYDSQRNFQFINTQNNTWNVFGGWEITSASTGVWVPQGYDIYAGPYPFTKYNNVINPGKLLGYDRRTELTMPYGPASPNRAGAYADLLLGFKFDKDITAEVNGFLNMPSELEDTVVYSGDTKLMTIPYTTYMIAGGGVKLNLYGIVVSAGAKLENADNAGSTVKLDNILRNLMTIDAGLKIPLFNFEILGGFKSQTWTGTEFSAKQNIDGGVTYIGGGIKYNISKTSYLNILYSTAEYVDNYADTIPNPDTPGANTWHAQEIDANLSFKF
ncbi:MAG: hypothetical protein WCJ46_06670 [bacterium]